MLFDVNRIDTRIGTRIGTRIANKTRTVRLDAATRIAQEELRPPELWSYGFVALWDDTKLIDY